MGNEKMQAAMKNLEDAMVVMSFMEKRQTERLLRHDAELEELAEARARSEQTVLRLQTESAGFQRRTEQNLAEITDKLNGLIGYVEGRWPN
jgi:hypothetical protein